MFSLNLYWDDVLKFPFLYCPNTTVAVRPIIVKSLLSRAQLSRDSLPDVASKIITLKILTRVFDDSISISQDLRNYHVIQHMFQHVI